MGGASCIVHRPFFYFCNNKKFLRMFHGSRGQFFQNEPPWPPEAQVRKWGHSNPGISDIESMVIFGKNRL
jgi:hypothetical protein